MCSQHGENIVLIEKALVYSLNAACFLVPPEVNMGWRNKYLSHNAEALSKMCFQATSSKSVQASHTSLGKRGGIQMETISKVHKI